MGPIGIICSPAQCVICYILRIFPPKLLPFTDYKYCLLFLYNLSLRSMSVLGVQLFCNEF